MPAARVAKSRPSLLRAIKDQTEQFRVPACGFTTVRRSIVLVLGPDERGVVAVLTALALTVLVGAVGLAVDVGMRYRENRALQNAADAAVIAAALKSSSSYQNEAKAVAAQYGFVDGASGITVAALNNQTCPDGTTVCYQVTVAQSSAPRFFSPVVGNFAPSLAGAAMASGSQTHSYCLVALGGSGTDPAIRTNGVPNADFTGCSIMSNTGADCNGHDLKATYGDAHKTNNGCGITPRNNVQTVADPYSLLSQQYPCRYLRRHLSARANEKEGSTSAVVQPMVRLKDPARHATHLWRLAAYWQHDPDYCIARFSPRYLQRAAGHEWEYVANGRGLGADHHFYRHYRKLYACPNGRWDIGLPSANIRYLERNRYLSGSRLDHWG